MLNTTITLSVDKANSGTVVNEVFTYDTHINPNKSMYYGDLHSVDSKETLVFSRVQNKVNGNFKGVFRTSQKYTRDVEVLGVDGSTLKVPAITECSDSFPVGMSDALKKEIRQYMIALRDNDSVMDAVHVQGQV